MPQYDLIEFCDNYLKTSGILRQCCRDELIVNAVDSKRADFTQLNAITDLFKIKEKVIDDIYDDCTTNIK